MQREIKFRGKCIDNGEWIYGYYMEISFCDGQGRGSYIKIDGYSPIKVDPDTVGQFTGIKDINGTDIYEGDRVEYITDIINYIPFKERGVVEYQSNIAMFILNTEMDQIPLSYCTRGIEVI